MGVVVVAYYHKSVAASQHRQQHVHAKPNDAMSLKSAAESS